MLTDAHILDALKELEVQFRMDQRAREEQYLKDRQALTSALDVARRLHGNGSMNSNGGVAFHQTARNDSQPQDIVVATRIKKRNNRDLVREVARKMPLKFTRRDMLETAQADPDAAIRNLSEGTIHATMHWFKKHGLVEVIRERQGKTDGEVYRLISNDLRRPAIVSKRNAEFPLIDMVMAAIEQISEKSFGKQSVFEKVRDMHPEFASRIKADSVSATLNKLASPQIQKIRCLEKGNGGHANIYERISASNE